jgi:hypothetical protein
MLRVAKDRSRAVVLGRTRVPEAATPTKSSPMKVAEGKKRGGEICPLSAHWTYCKRERNKACPT